MRAPLTSSSIPLAHAGGSAEGRWEYRADIDGLRAVAVVLVVTYHVWFGRVSGGVDVFLMLSAFFLTRGFVRRMNGPVPIRPLRHALGVFRRLLPAAAVTLIAVLALVRTVYPPTVWTSVWEQTWASLLYMQNVLLAADAVDYYARTASPSPLQHFWSLSVQGQAFLLWIAILAVCQLIVRRGGLSPDRVVGAVFGVVFLTSFAYSVFITAVDQRAAYFDTGARLWEFAAGSLLVILLPHIRVGERARALLGWVGLIALLALGFVVDVQGGFPGFLALWPILCAAAIIVSGSGERQVGPARLLATRPLGILGRDAYALYLVHWPLLITLLLITGRTDAGIVGGALVIGASLVLARGLTALVDAPVRAWRRTDSSPLIPIAVLVSATAIVVTPLAAWQVSVAVQDRELEARALRDNPGAAVLREPGLPEPPSDAILLPLPTALDDEWVYLDQECTGDRAVEDDILRGTCSETRGTPRARETVVVIGDSHAQQMTGALLPVAAQNGWGVIFLIKGGCSVAFDEPGMDEFCEEWRETAVAHVERVRPSAVMTVVTRSAPGDGDEVLRPGIEQFLERMGDIGAEVFAVRDNPRFSYDMFGCVIEADDHLDCAAPRSSSMAETNPALPLAGPGVRLVDLTPWICPDEVCLGVIGNVAAYRDDNHLSRTYARTLAPSLADQLPVRLG